MNAYDKIYLEDAAFNLAVMADCGINNLGCPAREFWSRFLASSIADRFSTGAVDVLVGHSGIELALMVMKETGRDISGCSPIVSISSEEFWAGMNLAYYQWRTGMSFKELSRCGLDLPLVISMFDPFHEADPSVFFQAADGIIEADRESDAWLKEMRKACGLTQAELSVRSDVPIRLIRAYEQGTIKLANAEYHTVVSLKRALGMVV